MKELDVKINNIIADQKINDIILRQPNGEYYRLSFVDKEPRYTRSTSKNEPNTTIVSFTLDGVFNKTYDYIPAKYFDFNELLSKTKSIEFIVTDLYESCVIKPSPCPISIDVAKALFYNGDKGNPYIKNITHKSVLTEDFDLV